MRDFETHSVGTANRLKELEGKIDQIYIDAAGENI